MNTLQKIQSFSLTAIIAGAAVLLHTPEVSASSCPGVVNVCQHAFTCVQKDVFCASAMPAGCTQVTQSLCTPVQCTPGIAGFEMFCFYQ